MDTNFYKKFRISGGMKLLTIDAPEAFHKAIADVPGAVTSGESVTGFDQVHWFVKTVAEFNKKLKTTLSLLKPGQVCWIYFPKGTSGIQTDLTRDTAWQIISAVPEIRWLNLVSFDSTWSAFAITPGTGDRRARAVKSQTTSDHIDTTGRIIRIPEDLRIALDKHPDLAAYFESLAFTHRKEYVEWILTARKEQTRLQRIEGTLERLKKKWKNPRNI